MASMKPGKNWQMTVQTVAWLPGRVSPIHNHATWGVVALISGEEKNKLWRRTDNQGGIEKAGEIILTPGEIISLMPFDPVTCSAKNF